MYNIEEIKSQNQYDCWSMMYMAIASSILKTCGRAGEGAIREGIRRLGALVGEGAREKIAAAGLGTNLSSLFKFGLDPTPDPRFRTLLIREDEQVRLWEIHTCPFADLWKSHGASDIGHLYCEEFYHSCVRAFTKGKGQTNVAKTLTHEGDNHCRFSIYFRPANLDPAHRAESFPESEDGADSAKVHRLESYGAGIPLKEKCLLTYTFLLETAVERFGSEGSCAVALGLRGMAPEMAGAMRRHAEATGKKADEEFLSLNFPLPLKVADDPFWEPENRKAAGESLELNFMRNFRDELGL